MLLFVTDFRAVLSVMVYESSGLTYLTVNGDGVGHYIAISSTFTYDVLVYTPGVAYITPSVSVYLLF